MLASRWFGANPRWAAVSRDGSNTLASPAMEEGKGYADGGERASWTKIVRLGQEYDETEKSGLKLVPNGSQEPEGSRRAVGNIVQGDAQLRREVCSARP